MIALPHLIFLTLAAAGALAVWLIGRPRPGHTDPAGRGRRHGCGRRAADGGVAVSTPRGHELGHPKRFTNDAISIFQAYCCCGLAVHGRRLPIMWAAHDEHLAHVKRLSMGRHPSGGAA